MAKELHLCKPVRRCAPAAPRVCTSKPRVYVCPACGCTGSVTRLRVCIYRLPAKPPPSLSRGGASTHFFLLLLATYSNYCAPPHMCVFVVRFRAGWYACSHTDGSAASPRVFVCIRVPYMPRPIVSAPGGATAFNGCHPVKRTRAHRQRESTARVVDPSYRSCSLLLGE